MGGALKTPPILLKSIALDSAKQKAKRQVSNVEHERTTRLILSGMVLYVFAGVSGAFFWLYAVWVLLRQDRIVEAAGAFVVAPIGFLYGFLRFFGLL